MPDEIKDTPVSEVKAVAVTPVKLAPGRMGTGAPDAPQIGLGTTLSIGGTVQVKVQSVKPPTWTGKDVEVTGMNDTFDTYIPGVPNNGEAEFDILYMKSQQATLWGLKNTPATAFIITYPDAGARTWTGWINSINEEAVLKDKISCKIKVRASTVVTVA